MMLIRYSEMFGTRSDALTWCAIVRHLTDKHGSRLYIETRHRPSGGFSHFVWRSECEHDHQPLMLRAEWGSAAQTTSQWIQCAGDKLLKLRYRDLSDFDQIEAVA